MRSSVSDINRIEDCKPTMSQDHVQKQHKMTLLACLIWTLGAVFYCYEYYLRVAPSVMMSDLGLAYNASAVTLGNLAACYYYAYTAMQVPVGVLMDKFGPRRILTFACFLCALGSYLFCATDALWVAGVGRFLVGFGSAFAYVGVLKLTTLWLPSNLFAMFSGLATTLGMVGAISGDIVMTRMVSAVGWRDTVYYSAIAGLLLMPVLWAILRDDRRHLGGVSLTPSTSERPRILQSLKKMSLSPQMWINGVYGCCSYIIISAFAELWGIPFLRDAKHLSPDSAAYANSAIFLGFAIGGPLIGYYSDRIQKRVMPMVVGATLAALCLGIVLYVPHISVWMVYVLLFLAGLFSGAEVIVFAVGRDLNDDNVVATAVAFTNMAVMLGGVILQPLIGKLLDYFSEGTVVNGIHVYTEHDYLLAMSSLPMLLVLGAVLIALFLKDSKKPQ